MALRAITFDFWGTLYQARFDDGTSREPRTAILQRYLTAAGYDLPYDQVRAALDDSFRRVGEIWRGEQRIVDAPERIGWILVAATVFGYVLSYLQLPQQLSAWLVHQAASPYMVIVGINIILIVLGCIMDPAGILLVTIPIFVPVIKALGFDAVWFGVMFVVNMELAQITPPLGLNLFIIKSIAPADVQLKDILRGAWPFMVLDLIGLALVIIFPQIILWLPSTMLR